MGRGGDYVEFVLDCMTAVGPVKPVRFFGGTGLLIDGVQFAYVSGNNRLYFVVDDETRPRYEAQGMGPFWYTRKTGRREVRRWYELPEDVLQEAGELRLWSQDAIRIAGRTPSKRKAVAEARPAVKRKSKPKSQAVKKGTVKP